MGRPDRLAPYQREITERDRTDSSRAVAPLRRAPGALVLDTGELDVDDCVAAIVAALPAGAPTVTRDTTRYLPQTWAYRPAGFFVGLLLRLLGGTRTEGLENLPRTGPAIIVANHYTLADPLVAGWGTCWQIGRVVHMIAKIQIKGWPVLGWLGSQCGVIYVRRGTSDLDAQRALHAVLAAGRPMIIFPEGTRSPTGALIPARNGAALLALRSGAPDRPDRDHRHRGDVQLAGDLRTAPAGDGPHRSAIHPRHTARMAPSTGRELTEATTRIMREVAALLPPIRRGVYG